MNNGKDNYILSPEEWNKKTELNTKVHPLRVHRLHENDSIAEIRYLNGSTLYANCYQQMATSMNPAHWMMKLGMIAIWDTKLKFTIQFRSMIIYLLHILHNGLKTLLQVHSMRSLPVLFAIKI